MAVFELFVVDGELSDLINTGASRQEIYELTRTKGFKTLAENLLMDVYSGLTDINSVKGFVFAPTYEKDAA